MIAAALLCATGALLQEVDDSVALEWSVRRWCRAPASVELRDADWRGRAATLDALGRAAPESFAVDGATELAVRALADPHPNVRAQALDALARAPRAAAGAVPPAAWTPLVTDVFPPVRVALAGFLARRPRAGGADALLELAFDGDPRVAAAGRRALLFLPPGAPGGVAAGRELLARLYAQRKDRDLAAALTRVVRRRPDRELLDGAVERIFGEGGPERAPQERRAWRAAFEAARLGTHGVGEPDLLLAGWLAGDWLPERRALLVGAGRGGSPELAQALVDAVVAIGDWVELADDGVLRERWPGLLVEFERRPRRSIDERAELLQGDLLECALEALAPMELIERCEAAGAMPRTLARCVQECGRRAQRFDVELARRLLAPDRPSLVREATLEALGLAFLHRGDLDAGACIAELAADPGDGRGDPLGGWAFVGLARSDEAARFVDALHAYWLTRSRSERSALLERLPRGVALTPFRDELLELGDDPERRRRVLELLAGMRGDAVVRGALLGWLDADLARVTDGARDAAWHYVELRVMALVRTLARVADDAEAIDALERALVRTVGVSSDVGKTAAAALARSVGGRARLVPWVGRDDLDRRTRIEAAIHVAVMPLGEAPPGSDGAHGRAVAALVADFEHAAWDLKSRMLDALAETPAAGAVDVLAELTRRPGLLAEIQREAALALAARGSAAIAPLAELARTSPDVEMRRVAVASLGKLGGEEARARLVELWRSVTADPGERELLREELLAALGRAGAFPDELLGEFLRRPLAVADEIAAKRFRGDVTPSVDFAWRGELELARELAREARLAEALARAGPWWRLDARMLVTLGERALESGNAAERETARGLLEAGLVALAGEADADRAIATTTTFRVLALAREAGEWGTAAAVSEELLWRWCAGEMTGGVFAEALGVYDRATGVDPRGRLVAGGLHARARVALAEGDVGAARALAARARAECGASRAALADQAALEAELAAGD